MMNERQRLNKQMVVRLALLICFVLVGFFVYGSLQKRGKIEIPVEKVPGDAAIYVNEKLAKSNPLLLPPGEYKIRGEKEGFKSYTYTISIKKDETIEDPLVFSLAPISQGAKKWAAEHARDYQKLEARGAARQEKEDAKNLERYPIIEKLPYRGSLYNIDYYQDESTFKIQISSPDALGRQVATERIRSWGYEPSDYIVEFVDLPNPFVNPEATNE